LAGNAQVEGIATNGTDVWLVDAKQDRVYIYSNAASRLSGSQNALSNFKLKTTFFGLLGNTNAKDIVTDGTSLWVVDDGGSNGDFVYKYTVSGSYQGSWQIDVGNTQPTGLTIDPSGASQNIWIVDNGTDRIYEYPNARSLITGAQQSSESFALASGNINPQGIADPPPPSDSAPMPNTVMAPPTAIALMASVANSKTSDIALIQLSGDVSSSRVGKPFERNRVDSELSLVPPQSRNSVIAFSTQQLMQPARSENRTSSQTKRLVGTTDDIFSNWNADEQKEFDF